ncbi:hypothetical protein ACHAWC_001471 [Mediolabrus comicus]
MTSRRSIKPRRITRQQCHGKRADSSNNAKMMQRSKPIPIPLRVREADPNVHDDEDMAEETKLYKAATWRMYELISAARLRRAAANYYYQAGDSQQHMLTRDDSAPAIPPQKLQRHRRAYSLPAERRPSAPSPSSSLMDGVFVMDSL